ncbi:helix-turn-helix transcriptional regulator [Nocardioides humilatus]|uniref:Helix-turn-helix transcriptional regulator n=1 Tax=Nocardioides humilatus TaxID=2607660 RepID=A0A5B1LLL7_9ACTN|nr:helix-turn-helix transcriptional regulator [Nocardioides humilatus]KAA1421602.1 helix-turn-helix transcriptional regulator [Nocardioides humilatus]
MEDEPLDEIWRLIGHGELNAAATRAQWLLELPGSPERRAEIESAFGLMLQRVGRIAESRDRFESAAELTAQVPKVQASYIADAAGSRFLLGDLAGAAAQAAHARLLGDRHANRFAACEAINTEVAVALSEGRTTDALRLAKQGVSLRAAERESTGGGPMSHLYLALTLIDLDRFAEADEAFEEGIAHSRADASFAQLTWYLGFRSLARFLNGRWPEAMADAVGSIDAAERTGTLIGRPIGMAVQAMVQAARGNRDAALAHVAPTEGALFAVGLAGEDWGSLARSAAAASVTDSHTALVEGWLHTRRTPYFLSWRSLAPMLVRTSLHIGDPTIVASVVEACRAGAELAAGVPSAQGAALLCRALADDDPTAAEEALEHYRRADRPFALAQAGLDAARLHLRAGAPGHATRSLREAIDIFDSLQATPWLARAGQLLVRAAPSAPPPPAAAPPAGWSSLTPTEQRVAKLLASGLTNPAIAAELYVSPRTIQTHASNIYAKLGITSRVQLAGMMLPTL